MTYCRTFWGSHGCALPQGHADADHRHQCGLAADDDGLCSVIERDSRGQWTVRYSTLHADRVDDDGKAYPTSPYGEDFRQLTTGRPA